MDKLPRYEKAQIHIPADSGTGINNNENKSLKSPTSIILSLTIFVSKYLIVGLSLLSAEIRSSCYCSAAYIKKAVHQLLQSEKATLFDC